MYDLIKQADEFRSFRVSMILNPKLWGDYPDRLGLSWTIVRFDQAHLEQVPKDERGVYSFVIVPGIANHVACAYLIYVGKTERSFYERYREYLYGQRTGNNIGAHQYEMLTKWEEHLWFCFASISNTSAIKQIEDDLIGSFLPPYNKEFPATVRAPMGVLRK